MFTVVRKHDNTFADAEMRSKREREPHRRIQAEAHKEANQLQRIRDGWVITTERKDYVRETQRFSAQAKVYYDDGTTRMLHEHSGETKQAAEAKEKSELDQFMSQHS